nr:MAG TPA: hypothetical protein [Caudoviricetes sp.]
MFLIFDSRRKFFFYVLCKIDIAVPGERPVFVYAIAEHPFAIIFDFIYTQESVIFKVIDFKVEAVALCEVGSGFSQCHCLILLSGISFRWVYYAIGWIWCQQLFSKILEIKKPTLRSANKINEIDNHFVQSGRHVPALRQLQSL